MDLNNLPLNFPQDSNPNDKIGVGVDHPHLHADLLKDAMQEEIINNNNKIVLQDFSGLLSTNHSIFSSATPMNLLSFTTATNGGVFPDQLLGQTHFTVKNETSTGPSDLASSVQMDSNGDALENMPVIKDERDNCAAALTCSLSGVPPQTASTINSAKVTTPTSKPAKCPERREKVFTCQTCNKSFGYKHVLQHHERIHTGEKPFECPHCEKRFKRDHHLKTHLRLHTAEKPYHCDQCDRYFVQMGNLRRHLRVHTGERPYPCELCPSRFSDSNQLKHHVLIHKGEKPFECPNCLGRFRRRHRLLHHKCPGTVESSNAFLCKPVIADEDPSAGTKNRSAKTKGRKTYKRKCRVTKKVSKSLKSSSSSRKTAKIIPDKSNSNDSTEEDNLSDNSSHSEPTVDED